MRAWYVRGQAHADVAAITLNAHPACDRKTNECYVQHPCPTSKDFPISDLACFSKLVTVSKGRLKTKLPNESPTSLFRFIQLPHMHAHGSCVRRSAQTGSHSYYECYIWPALEGHDGGHDQHADGPAHPEQAPRQENNPAQ